jgi:hypothetical protein
MKKWGSFPWEKGASNNIVLAHVSKSKNKEL